MLQPSHLRDASQHCAGCIAEAAKKGSIIQTFVGIGRVEGLKGYWKGNLPQVGVASDVFATSYAEPLSHCNICAYAHISHVSDELGS
jgi:hypothetical protein